jgi:RsiW-degrading membrane proteinase PrsW (M82 family)
MNLNSTTFLYGIIAGIVPSLLWLWFWLKEDNLHDEPRITLAGCFFTGMGMVFIALPLEWIAGKIFPDTFHQYIAWAAVEETLKFVAAYLIVFQWKKLNEPVDAMIYMITAALGFAALENSLFLLGVLNTGNVLSGIVTGNMRFIGATLLHLISSAMIGFMIALAYYHGKTLKFIAGAVGLALAISLHAAFNLAIITSTAVDTLKIFAWVWAGVIVLILLFEEVKGMELKRNSVKKK